MATIHTVSHCDESELMHRIRPRDDVLIAERLPSESPEVASPGEVADAGRIELVGIAGPFRRYTRTLEWDRVDTAEGASTAAAGTPAYEVRQRIDYQLAIPYWRWLFELPVRRSLPDGLAGDRRPWWSTPDRLSPQQSTMVAAVTLFNLVGGLLYGLLTQVLTFIAADLGDGSSSEQTTLLAVVRIGVVLTMLVMVLADRVGRRRVALASFVASAALTLVTALAPSLWAVGALQFFSRNLAIAGLLCVDTIAVEEMPPGSRAMVAGLGTLAYGLGAGIIVMTLPLADLGDWGWRLTFVVAGMSLPLIWHASRHLPESRRFERLARLRDPHAVDGSGADPAAGSAADGAADGAGTVYVDEQDAVALAAMNTELTTESLAPLAAAVDSTGPVPLESGRVNVWRFALVGAIFFLLNVFLAPSSQLQNDYLRAEVGFSGLMISIFVLTTSTPGGIGVLLGGRLADVRGRRWAIVPGLLAIGVFNAIFFSVVGVPMWIASLFGSVIGGLAAPAMSVIAPELFPTARRGTVRGAVAAIAVTGSVVGLLASGRLIDSNGYAFAFTVLAVAPIAAAVIALAIPETRGRELEDINR